MDFEQSYRAISARDRRFDGQFITAVRTTGIYCRPSCPARTPKPENVTFFRTSAAAHQAGYRACKRCLPEAVPGTPEWNLRDDLVGRAMRLIADGEIERAGVVGLAARLGYTSRHVTRVLTDELGAGPLALARALRAQTARTLLVSTDMPITDVAFAAGFASIRQFNETVGEVFQLSPTAIRGGRSIGASASGRIDLRLPTREPFDGSGVLSYLGAHAGERAESVSEQAYSRTVGLVRGTAAVEVRVEPDGLRLSARLDELRDLPVLIARVRRLFDLDADPEAIDAALAADPALQSTIRSHPGIRLPGTLEPAEIVTRAVAGETHGATARRAAVVRAAEDPTVQEVARRVDGAWPIEELRGALLALGTPAASQAYAIARILGAPDVDPAADPMVLRGMRAAGLGIETPDQFSPWRSYAALHLCKLGAVISRRRRGSPERIAS